jgi:Zn-dependent M28 family amino/carboxypeptidase
MLLPMELVRGAVLARSVAAVFLVMGIAITAIAQATFQFQALRRDIVEARLKAFVLKNAEREQELKSLFQQAGCDGDQLSEEAVKHLKEPNVACTLPGKTSGVILVGAHYDHVDVGDGVVDNWSGASLLPSLFQVLKSQPRKHTYVFVAFSGEEKGLVGSEYYAKHLTAAERANMEAMINLDTLGLGPTEVWVSHGDKRLVMALNAVAQAVSLPLTGMNVDGVGSSDSESFAKLKIPSLTVHSVTQNTLRVLHSTRDNLDAIRMNDYYDSYRLLAGYLTFLDSYLTSPEGTTSITEASSANKATN